MTALIKNFAKSESGAVTVDWVVLTAAIVGLGLAVMAVVSGGVEDLSRDIDNQLRTNHIDNSFN
jgi:Flp pilus assembly pilin Flp